ncbi:MAG: amidohydrolase [Erysipelotrichaceae bacterium]|nr:amidohydrolase [Erysipelotrichaceae bacterium]
MINEEISKRIEEEVFSYINENEQYYIDLSKKIWDLAEIQFQEYESARLLSDKLREEGFAVEMGVAGIPTAFVATYKNGEGPVVATYGEYDALKGLGHEIATTRIPNGRNGHGCGHNLMGAACVAGAVAAKSFIVKNGIKGSIRYFGCPAEEGGSAKVFMVRAGVFDGVDANIHWHPANANMVSQAAAMAIMSVRYHFYGKAAHAGVCPHLGRSALDAAILMDVAANYLREHVPPDTRIQCVITKGGDAPNIVPAEAEIWYYIRAPKRQQVDEVFERMNKIAQGMAMATETTVEIKVGSGATSNGMPNNTLSEMVLRNMKKVGGPKFSKEDYEMAKALNAEVSLSVKRQSMAQMYNIVDPDLYSVDLSEYIDPDMMRGTVAPYSGDGCDVAWQIPSAQFNTCCQPVGTGNHSWQQVVCSGSSIGWKGMICAAKILGLSLCEAICDEELLKKARRELDDKLAEYPYTCPIPDDVMPDLEGKGD